MFVGYSDFLHYLQLASHESATIGINVTKNDIPNTMKVVYNNDDAQNEEDDDDDDD